MRDFLRRLKPAIVADADEETENDGAGGDAIRQRGMEDGAEEEEEEEVYLTPVESGDDNGSSRQLTFSDLISFSFQVARGMEYLSSRKAGHLSLTVIFLLAVIPVILPAEPWITIVRSFKHMQFQVSCLGSLIIQDSG